MQSPLILGDSAKRQILHTNSLQYVSAVKSHNLKIKLLPGEGAAAASGGGEPPPKDEKGLKEWVRNKLKALASLLGKLGMKGAEALPGIIGGIISWILNRAKDVVGWVLQNLWSLVAGIERLIYTYMVTRK